MPRFRLRPPMTNLRMPQFRLRIAAVRASLDAAAAMGQGDRRRDGNKTCSPYFAFNFAKVPGMALNAGIVTARRWNGGIYRHVSRWESGRYQSHRSDSN